jgi:hypothetical protein
MIEEALAAIALVTSPENLMPPSAMTGMSCPGAQLRPIPGNSGIPPYLYPLPRRITIQG